MRQQYAEQRVYSDYLFRLFCSWVYPTIYMAKEVIKEGSPALFSLIKILNLVFGLSAIALIALGIWLWREFNKFHIIEIVFISLGLLEFLLVLFIFTAKTSVIK